MNVLLIGSGGREHALAWKLTQSSFLNKLFIAPGNAGTADLGQNINVDVLDFENIKKMVLTHNIELVIVGPEIPLVAGLHDFFETDSQLKKVAVIGPKKEGALLEGSKEFAKEFMQKHNIPTAKYKSFTLENIEESYTFLESLSPPYVLKADGLAAGKGVLILKDLQLAKFAMDEILIQKKFGKAGHTVVIEEFLDGIEMSCFALTDGYDYVILPNAKDYKRIGEGDTGLNTGGMGAVSPVPFASEDLLKKIETTIIKPTITGLQKDKIEFQGFLFFGLMIVNNKPFVIEYNVRLGDPETEVIIPRINSDLLELFNATANGCLSEFKLEINPKSAATVMLVSGGYPEAYQKGKEISGLDSVQDSLLFHAGTMKNNNKLVTNGGRVLAVTSYGDTVKEALKKSYKNTDNIIFDNKNFRKDIGFDL